MAKRSVVVDRSTLHRWIIRLVSLLDKAFRRHKRRTSHRWRMDETYIKIWGQWKYLYRAVDISGQTIDFLLTEKEDAATVIVRKSKYLNKLIDQDNRNIKHRIKGMGCSR